MAASTLRRLRSSSLSKNGGTRFVMVMGLVAERRYDPRRLNEADDDDDDEVRYKVSK